MTMLAGSEGTFEQRMIRAADRLHAVPRGVAPGVNSVGEDLMPGEYGSPDRVEVRLSLYLSPDDLLAALWDSGVYFEISGPAPVELIRFHALSALMVLGGPDSLQVEQIAAEARADRGSEEFARVAADIERAFGITV